MASPAEINSDLETTDELSIRLVNSTSFQELMTIDDQIIGKISSYLGSLTAKEKAALNEQISPLLNGDEYITPEKVAALLGFNSTQEYTDLLNAKYNAFQALIIEEGLSDMANEKLEAAMTKAIELDYEQQISIYQSMSSTPCETLFANCVGQANKSYKLRSTGCMAVGAGGGPLAFAACQGTVELADAVERGACSYKYDKCVENREN